MIILGIDPSLRGTGWGIVQKNGSDWKALDFGVVKNAASLRPTECLVAIEKQLSLVIAQYKPNEVAIEGLFFAQNIRTALMMGQARGVALLAAAAVGLEIFEYAPRRVKQSVTGRGAAAKNQVGYMVRALLGLTHTPEGDAADALAIALTHGNSRKGIAERISL